MKQRTIYLKVTEATPSPIPSSLLDGETINLSNNKLVIHRSGHIHVTFEAKGVSDFREK